MGEPKVTEGSGEGRDARLIMYEGPKQRKWKKEEGKMNYGC